MGIEFLNEFEICDLVDVFELFIPHLVNWLFVNQVSLNTEIVFRKSFTGQVAGIFPRGFLFIRAKAVIRKPLDQKSLIGLHVGFTHECCDAELPD